jgi:hypothetical protein
LVVDVAACCCAPTDEPVLNALVVEVAACCCAPTDEPVLNALLVELEAPKLELFDTPADCAALEVTPPEFE